MTIGIFLHSDNCTRWQAARHSPLCHFPISLSTKVSVQFDAVNMKILITNLKKDS